MVASVGEFVSDLILILFTYFGIRGVINPSDNSNATEGPPPIYTTATPLTTADTGRLTVTPMPYNDTKRGEVYEIIKENAPGLRILSVTQNDRSTVELYLKRVRDNVVDKKKFGVWLAKTVKNDRGNFILEKYTEKIPEGIVYESPDKYATMLVYKTKEADKYGVLGRFGNGVTMTEVNATIVDWKGPTKDDPNFDDRSAMNEKNPDTGKLRILYPKVLVIVDFSLYNATFYKNVEEIVRYMTVLWNGVNLRYKDFTDPKVRFTLSGLIIEKDATALRFINDSRLPDNRLNVDHVLRLGSVYLDKIYRENMGPPFTETNMLMTGIGIARRNGRAVIGSSRQGSICDAGAELLSGMMNDDGSLFSVGVALHEMAHTMTLHHDAGWYVPDNPSNQCDGYDSLKNNSYMTSPSSFSAHLYWSACSKKELLDFASNPDAECLRYLEPQNNVLRIAIADN